MQNCVKFLNPGAALKLLDEAVAPAFPAQALSRTPRSGLLRHSACELPAVIKAFWCCLISFSV